jgi:ubiquitin carboxyl-terminal hydrolase 25/28
LNKYKDAAKNQVSDIEAKVKELEDLVQEPYASKTERQYHLHAIMIHDGYAEQGHYYSYLFDRYLQQWWKFDDHRVSQVCEEQVMRDARGGYKDKSACNLFYVNQKIADSMDHCLFI